MKIQQKHWTKDSGWRELSEGLAEPPHLVFAFGSSSVMKKPGILEEIREFYPSSHLLLCSTAGEIINGGVYDDSLALTAVYFEKSTVQVASADIFSAKESARAGRELAEKVKKDGLVHIMVFSDGLKVNGTSLVNGMMEVLPPEVSVTGGLVGDGADFRQTFVGIDEEPREGRIAAIGFYGDIRVGYGSRGGWNPFGLERVITKSEGNVLYELDGKPALALYKQYLGEKTKDLPGSALLFPLRIKNGDGEEKVEVVRTVLSVNEKDQSMTFAGDMPQGAHASLMKANSERLIDGASQASAMSLKGSSIGSPELAVLISCVGRKLVLKERTEEEVEAVEEALPGRLAVTGFYSYGEICPFSPEEKTCHLHNQTMTVTVFSEK